MRRKSLNIGEYYASRDPMIISTLLGSCVATCIFDPNNRIGGMNHILFPSAPDMKTHNQPARYGVHAMELLINKVMALGGHKANLKAKIFGGANVLPMIKGDFATGPKIVAFVKEYLSLASIPIIAENTGGEDTRVIYFHTDSGDVYLRRSVRKSLKQLLIEEENLKQVLLDKIAANQDDPSCKSNFFKI